MSATTHEQTRLTAIGQIAIVVQDVARATAFYRDTLGLKFLFEAPGLAFFDCNGVRLMLSKPSHAEFDHPGSILYYKVADLKATVAELEAKGVKFEGGTRLVARMPEYELWMAFFRDSEGNPAELMSEVRS